MLVPLILSLRYHKCLQKATVAACGIPSFMMLYFTKLDHVLKQQSELNQKSLRTAMRQTY
jgi:hypothetical protein